MSEAAFKKRLQAGSLVLFLMGSLILLLSAVSVLYSSTDFKPVSRRKPPSEMAKSLNNRRSLAQSVCFRADPSPQLKQFMDALPIIPMINISSGQTLVMKAYRITQTLHRDLPATTLYGFGTSEETAQVPGPILVAMRNVTSYVRWENHITDKDHFLTVDETVTPANPRRRGVPMVTHLHGMEVESKYDGHPEAWFTKYGEMGPKFETRDYVYNNNVLPSLLWYHDHTIGMTRDNVVAGLAGPYLVRGGPHEEPIGLPDGDREILLMIQDKQFFANGSINFPSVGDDPSIHPNWCPGYYGDTILVNGKVWPYLKVLPLRYRFRIINGASERYFRLSLNRSNMTFLKIGTDGGYLRSPVVVEEILLAPAERVDCIVDFGGLDHGTKVVLNNTAASPFPAGQNFANINPEVRTRAILLFRVGKSSKVDASVVPSILADNMPSLTPVTGPQNQTRVRRFTLTETINNVGNVTQAVLANRTWGDPATELALAGSTEVWQFIGLTPDIAHPIHVHLIRFQVLSVQQFNTSAYLVRACSLDRTYGQPNSCFTHPARGPNPQEIGWKDTVSAGPGVVTSIVMRFTSIDGNRYRFDPSRRPGYLWHCHLLSHEDNSMMRPLLFRI